MALPKNAIPLSSMIRRVLRWDWQGESWRVTLNAPLTLQAVIDVATLLKMELPNNVTVPIWALQPV